MFKVALLALLCGVAFGAYYEDLIARHANEQTEWEQGYNKRFAGYTKERIMKMMGTRLDSVGRPGIQIKKFNDKAMPTSWDAAAAWPKCASTINFIKDQADCGSCWAVAASEVVGDRTCIANQGSLMGNIFLNENQPAVDMSAEQIMACCSYCGDGCQGGYPIDAMRYWCWNGVVTGGWYGSGCGCQSYKVPPCGPQGCQGPEANTPMCSHSCDNSNINFNSDKHYCSDHYMVDSSSNAIMQEMMQNGPVECAFTVYEDFMAYKSGVYKHTWGQELGGHAVKCRGWGQTSSGTKYWVFDNSWNVTWGLQGRFWIIRDNSRQNCGIQSQCVAGKAKTGDSSIKLMC